MQTTQKQSNHNQHLSNPNRLLLAVHRQGVGSTAFLVRVPRASHGALVRVGGQRPAVGERVTAVALATVLDCSVLEALSAAVARAGIDGHAVGGSRGTSQSTTGNFLNAALVGVRVGDGVADEERGVSVDVDRSGTTAVLSGGTRAWHAAASSHDGTVPQRVVTVALSAKLDTGKGVSLARAVVEAHRDGHVAGAGRGGIEGTGRRWLRVA